MAIEREMDGAYLRLAEAAAAMRYRQRHYLLFFFQAEDGIRDKEG